jgi:hypothetical protein
MIVTKATIDLNGQVVLWACAFAADKAKHPSHSGSAKACAIQTRAEHSAGFRRLTTYLAAWAAFDQWLQQRPPKTN